MSELGIQKMQEYLDYYIDEVNRGNRSFTEALDELVEIERKHNQTRREQANVKTANFPFIKTVEDFDFDFQPDINKKEILELNTLRFRDRHEKILSVDSRVTVKTPHAIDIGRSCARDRNIQ